MDACGLQTETTPKAWECVARPGVVPRGGQATLKFRVVAELAPQAKPITLDGAWIEVQTFKSGGVPVQDATPASNTRPFKLVLEP